MKHSCKTINHGIFLYDKKQTQTNKLNFNKKNKLKSNQANTSSGWKIE